MAHGPTYYESRGVCIYFGSSSVRLTDEHVVPLSLGGVHILRQASCLSCADITKKFEQKVARDLWGDARTSFNAPTRRKRERRTHIKYKDPDDANRVLMIPANEYPAIFVFYKMGQAGFLRGLADTVDVSNNWQMIVIEDDLRRINFLKKYAGKVVGQFRHVPHEFGRLLAKIGYCQLLTALDPDDFHAICLPYILDQKKNISYVVGGSMEDHPPLSGIGFRLFGDDERQAAMREAEAVMVDYKRIRLAQKSYRKLRAGDTAQFHSLHKSWLKGKLAEPFPGKTVVITHMAPSILSISDRYASDPVSASYASRLDDIAIQSDYWIHGHMHESFDYQIGKCRVVCNPCGYMTRGGGIENEEFNPNFILELE